MRKTFAYVSKRKSHKKGHRHSPELNDASSINTSECCTVYLYSPSFVYQYVSSSGIALVQLMAYISSCCNPITYCFMNRRFRQAFLAIFSCHRNR
ncbi:AGAP001022-PB-like protein [Anopheles sinensis]|uniref:AGAP001022-PB-like protein n=1 Tax=Anopheles sinensis TaxID=74873 RepID=A0A084WPY8_ANOSI|nr:AGAP001022-PB-like protein [Anopheles sinensis]